MRGKSWTMENIVNKAIQKKKLYGTLKFGKERGNLKRSMCVLWI